MLQLSGRRRGFNPSWARVYIPNKGQTITGSQNPGPAKNKPKPNVHNTFVVQFGKFLNAEYNNQKLKSMHVGNIKKDQ